MVEDVTWIHEFSVSCSMFDCVAFLRTERGDGSNLLAGWCRARRLWAGRAWRSTASLWTGGWCSRRTWRWPPWRPVARWAELCAEIARAQGRRARWPRDGPSSPRSQQPEAAAAATVAPPAAPQGPSHRRLAAQTPTLNTHISQQRALRETAVKTPKYVLDEIKKSGTGHVTSEYSIVYFGGGGGGGYWKIVMFRSRNLIYQNKRGFAELGLCKQQFRNLQTVTHLFQTPCRKLLLMLVRFSWRVNSLNCADCRVTVLS